MSSFDGYLQAIGKSAKTARNYAGAISGPLSKWVVDNNLAKFPITDISNVIEFEKLCIEIRKLPIYTERNTVGKGMYNAALNAYSAYLAELKGGYLEYDLDEILANPKTTATEKRDLVNCRIGQGEFRRQLISYWKGCAATGYRNTRLLVASHIKPWRSSNNNERLNVYNGLLLNPNLDKAFDLGYIGFRKSGRICISRELEEPDVLGVTEGLMVKLSHEHYPFIEHHLEKVFKN